MQTSADVSITLNTVSQSYDFHSSRRLRVLLVASRMTAEWPARNKALTIAFAIAHTNGSASLMKRWPWRASRMASGDTIGWPAFFAHVLLPLLGNHTIAIRVLRMTTWPFGNISTFTFFSSRIASSSAMVSLADMYSSLSGVVR